ncbi:MAG: GntR family transcriptional regulator [Paracoccaceae bacterium]
MDQPGDQISASDPYAILRDGLIWGRWKSGEKLKPQHLKTQFGCSGAALREALLRLAGEGLVEAEKHLGFRTVTHSADTFRQAAHLRVLLECEGARLALEQGDFDWEMALNAAHHNLEYIEQQMEVASDVAPFVKRWSRQDWQFHSTLMSACGSDMLMKAYRHAFDTFRMYAVSHVPQFGFSPLTRGQHYAVYTTAINRDIPGCLSAIHAHLAQFDHEECRPSQAAEEGER